MNTLSLMQSERLQSSDASTQAGAAVLKIGTLELMIRQGEMRTLEAASNMDDNDPEEMSVGWINYAQQRWPVYCLSSQLELLSSIPVERRACALMALEKGFIGVLCDDVVLLKQVSGQVYELPLIMRRADTPINGVVPYNQGIACISEANNLARYIRQKSLDITHAKEA